VASTIVGLSFSEIFKAFSPKKEIKNYDLRDYFWGLEPRSHPPLFAMSIVNAKIITCIFCYYGEIGVWKVSRGLRGIKTCLRIQDRAQRLQQKMN
jgi:hypothetical protein